MSGTSTSLGTCVATLLLTCGLAWTIDAAQPSVEQSRLEEPKLFLFVNVEQLRESASADADESRRAFETMLDDLSRMLGADMRVVQRMAYCLYPQGNVAIFRYGDQWNYDDWAAKLVQSGAEPKTFGETTYFALSNAAIFVWHDRSSRIALWATDESLLQQWTQKADAADADRFDPQSLARRHGADVSAGLFASATTPFTEDVRRILAYQFDGKTDDKALSDAGSGLRRIIVQFCPTENVPLNLQFVAASEREAEMWRGKLDALVVTFRGSVKDALAQSQDELDPIVRSEWQRRLLARLIVNIQVERVGTTAKMLVRSEGGLPRLFELCVLEVVRAGERAVHTFEEVSEQLK